jgi:AraC family transcriptional regulator
MTKPKLDPMFSNRRPLRVAGVGVHYAEQSSEAFAKQWESFAPMIGKMPGQIGTQAYGVVTGSFGGADGFEYITGVEVSSFDHVPSKFRRLTIPAQRYAVFVHDGHVSKIRDTMYTIKKEWLPKWMVPGRTDASKEGSDQPDFFERYGKEFDPKTGTGKVEIWVPLNR